MLLAAGLGCATEPAPADAELEEDYTTNTALARTVTFQGVVFVSNYASASQILEAVQHQTQSAFGAFRESNIAVNSRELGDVDPKTFVKTPVTVIDPAKPGMVTNGFKVSYKYTDTALVPKSMAKRSSMSLGLLHGNYDTQTTKILKDCTSNDKHAQEFASSVWYVFNPALSSCKSAMTAEQKKIDADRAKLKIPGQIPTSEFTRLYVPMTAKFTGNKTNKGLSYPEYDKLWSGGVKKGRLVISTVNGMLADWEAGGPKPETINDEGYTEWFIQMREVFKARPKFMLTKTDPKEDLTTYQVGAVKVTGAKFSDLIRWELDKTGWPKGITTTQQRTDLRKAVAAKLFKHWITFELPVQVKIGSAPAKTTVIEYVNYFGAEGSSEPHKKAIKSSDVFMYNGHSYIGYGPLDPGNFSSYDFPPSYQILFMDSCVSFNYYEKDYFPLKTGGTANLELITNGLETWTTGSGSAFGRFIAALIDGKQKSYTDLLKAAEVPWAYDWGGDALRVVDGEIDNKYSPNVKPITVSP